MTYLYNQSLRKHQRDKHGRKYKPRFQWNLESAPSHDQGLAMQEAYQASIQADQSGTDSDRTDFNCVDQG